MLHAIIGTKGQLIKMIPILKELENRRIEYNFINAGQHAQILDNIIKLYGIKQPDTYLDKRDKDIVTAFQAVYWIMKSTMRGILDRKIWKEDKGIVLIHGDAPPVIVGLIAAKLSGQRVAHIEAGLRSYDFLNPFPEELFRVIVDHFGDYLFAPTGWAENNLKTMKVKGNIYNTQCNTVIDMIRLSLNLDIDIDIPKEPYVVSSIHRFETISSKDTLINALDVVNDIAKDIKVVYVLHPSTENKLKKFNLLNYLDNKNIEIRPILEYPYFIKLVNNAEYVVTDGGGLQEETNYLGKPCLILRNKTERIEGLNSNVCLSEFRDEKIKDFIRNYDRYKSEKISDTYSPSKRIVDTLLEL